MRDLFFDLTHTWSGVAILAALFWTVHAVPFVTVSISLRRRAFWGALLSVFPTLACIALAFITAADGFAAIAEKGLALVVLGVVLVPMTVLQTIPLYVFFRRAKPEIEQRFFTESPTVTLTAVCALPVLGVAFAAIMFRPNGGIELKATIPWDGTLPVTFFRSKRQRIMLLGAMGVFLVMGQVLLIHGSRLIQSLFGVTAYVLSFWVWLLNLPQGNRLVIRHEGIY